MSETCRSRRDLVASDLLWFCLPLCIRQATNMYRHRIERIKSLTKLKLNFTFKIKTQHTRVQFCFLDPAEEFNLN